MCHRCLSSLALSNIAALALAALSQAGMLGQYLTGLHTTVFAQHKSGKVRLEGMVVCSGRWDAVLEAGAAAACCQHAFSARAPCSAVEALLPSSNIEKGMVAL